jgi:hypothetical protein
MRKLFTMFVAILTLLALTTTATLAVGPTSVTRSGGVHFVGQPNLTVSGTSLVATGEVAGAGPTATATLTATADVTRGCINRGSKDQQPSGLKRSFTTQTASETFRTRSGRGSFNVATEPISAAGFACPDRMVPVVVSITWTDISLTITSQTGSTTAYFPDQTWP